MEDMTLEKKILSTNDWGLVALLHEGLIERFDQAIRSIEEENYDGLEILINKSRDILTEFLVIFHENHELSTNLREIYNFVNKKMTEGLIKKDKSYFEEAIQVIEPILEGFRELEKQEEGNVVSGLTYGKENLQDHMTRSSRTFEG